ncbi:hypothetical protein OAQ84_01990, partial [Bdellovibrionales bacterium]|nr:hypothetical protein [Bdellovibrionales bacterium]
DPALLITLYNLGEIKKRAEKAKRKKIQPRPNYFGFFAEYHMLKISNSIKLGLPKISIKSGVGKKNNLVRTLKKSTSVYALPVQCKTGGVGRFQEYMKVLTITQFPPVSSVSGNYEILNRSMDCDMNDWSLVRDESGNMGWIKNSTLNDLTEEKIGSFKNSKISTCTNECRRKLAQSSNYKVLSRNSSGNSEDVQLIGLDGEKEINWRQFNMNCYDMHKNSAYHSVGGSDSSSSSLDEITKGKAMEILERVEQKKQDIMRAMKIDIWNRNKNRFRNDFGWSNNLNYCEPKCIGDLEKIEKFFKIDFLSIKGVRSYKKVKIITERLYIDTSPQQQDSGINSSDLKGQILSLEKYCKVVFSKSKKTKQRFKDLKARLKQVKKYNPNFILGSYQYKRMIKACRAGDEIVNGPEKQEGLKERTEAGLCVYCKVPITIVNGSSKSFSTWSLDVLKPILLTEEDWDEVFLPTMDNILNEITGQSGSRDKIACNYDPLKTAKLVDKILSKDCVHYVLVPDAFIQRKLSKKRKSILHFVFKEDDRLRVVFKGNCSGE